MSESFLMKIASWYNESQLHIAVILGAVIQSAFVEKKTTKLILTIFITAIFMNLYVTQPIIVEFKLNGSIYEPPLYAFVSLMSVELLSMLIHFLPQAFATRLKKHLGIKENDDVNK